MQGLFLHYIITQYFQTNAYGFSVFGREWQKFAKYPELSKNKCFYCGI
ncbi:hypothetical protein HFN_0622 [Helicobacter fennelliae MRY12-0050]|uniref:Uncharacterized protein n=1 Tax=Helicobacter fennelliae MRY12-0050 TaxID=1325130 RepID=T1DUN3_9HELI|nr:hypothetical protein HFN_0622 [Helicobacter fennelliae MRY12-0050]